MNIYLNPSHNLDLARQRRADLESEARRHALVVDADCAPMAAPAPTRGRFGRRRRATCAG